jgi:photosystem II stability/assembly factor-like uncharacterized protein
LEFIGNDIVLAVEYTTSYTDPNTFVVTPASSGRILRSTDAGDSWAVAATATGTDHFKQISYCSNGRVVASTWPTTNSLWRSYDDGETWASSDVATLPATLDQPNLKYVGSNTIIVSDDGDVYYSDDLGDNWSAATLPSGITYNNTSDFYTISEGVVLMISESSSYEAVINKSADYGHTWENVLHTSSDYFNPGRICNLGGGSLLTSVVDNNGSYDSITLVRSYDNGETWTVDDSELPSIDSGYRSFIVQTSDGGLVIGLDDSRQGWIFNPCYKRPY